MKTFREHLKEEVLPTALVQDGSFDLRRDDVRAQINAILSGITGHSCVTPYVALNKISKALAYFHIILPKRTYMQGDRGIEVYEMNQFGHKMGMTDQGEFVTEVPCKYYLFLQYLSIAGRYVVTAKVVDNADLDTLLSSAERVMAEDAATQQNFSKMKADKEPLHTIDADGTVSAKSAKDTSDRKKDKKLSADQLDEVSKGAAISAYRGKEAEDRSTGKLRGLIRKKWGEKTVKHAERAGAQDTGHLVRKGESHGTDYLSRAKSSSDMRKTKSGKVHKQDVESKKSEIKFRKTMSKFDKPRGPLPEESLDEAHKVTGVKGSETGDRYEMRTHAPGEHHEWSSIVKTHQGGKSTQNQWGGHSPLRTGKTGYVKKHFDKLEEKLTKKMKASDVISDFVHSDDPKFKGKSKKERMKMALGAYYGMHPEKSKNLEEGMAPVKKSYAMKKMKKKVSTQVKQGLGVGKEKTKTILVTNKGDPHARAGGGVHRISKDKYDPTKHNLASE